MFKDVATFTVIDEKPFFASFEQAIPRFDEIRCVRLEYWKYPDVSDLAGTYVFEAFFEDAGSADGAADIWAFACLTGQAQRRGGHSRSALACSFPSKQWLRSAVLPRSGRHRSPNAPAVRSWGRVLHISGIVDLVPDSLRMVSSSTSQFAGRGPFTSLIWLRRLPAPA